MEHLYSATFLGHSFFMWLSFFAVIVCLLIADLGIFTAKNSNVSLKKSILTSCFYIFIGIIFGFFILFQYDPSLNSSCAPYCHIQASMEYWTSFIIEKTLSIDNIFVMSLIFSYFSIPKEHQHRVLFWGILGVVFLRGVMIFLGATLVSEFHWVLYIFSAFLVFTGVKMLLFDDTDIDIENNVILKVLRRYLPVTESLQGRHFFVRQKNTKGKYILYCTPLFVALLTIECIDLVFAVDSVPAVFSITLDPYIIYTSNIFAIIGLRSLYFVLNAMIERFAYLKQALSIVLVFIGSKIFISWALGIDKFPTSFSLQITILLIAGGIIYSLRKTREEKT